MFRLRFWFLFFLFVFSLIFGPPFSVNVVAASEVYGFENSTLLLQVGRGESGGWLETWTDAGNTYVDDTHVKTGIRNYRFNGDPYGDNTYFNFTYDTNKLITYFSIPIYLSPNVVSGMFTFFFNTSSDEDIIRIFFQHGDGGVYSHVKYWSDSAADWVDLTGKWVNSSVWGRLNLTVKANDSVDYEFYDGGGQHFWSNDSAPSTVVGYESPRIVYMNVVHPSNAHDMWVDDFGVETGDQFIGNLTGHVNVSVFNESSPTYALDDWSVTVLNSLGGAIYNLNNQSNPTAINISNFGTGLRYFVIGRENYSSRTYYTVIEDGWYYSLDAFLPFYNPDKVHLYYVKVLNEYSQSVYDVSLDIRRNVNGTVINISSGHTDSGGFFPVFLIENTNYIIDLSHDDYESKTGQSFYTDPIYFGYDYPIIFYLSHAFPYTNYTLFYDAVDFTAEMIGAGYMQLGNITVNYTDSNSSTVDTDTYIYELYNGTATLVNVSSNTSQTFSYTVGNYSTFINTSRDHIVVLWFNNTADFADVTSPVSIYLSALYIYRGDRTRFSFNDRISNLFGPFNINGMNIGWHSIVSVVIAMIVLCLLGPYDTGLGILGAGLGIGLTDAMFQLWFTDTFPLLLVTLAPLLVIIGVLYLWAKHQGVEGI